MRKRLFSLALTLILALSLTPSAFASTADAGASTPETSTAPAVAAPSWSWSLLQPVNYWQDPSYAIKDVLAADLGDGQEYLYVFFENGKVVSMNSLFIVNWLAHDAADSWELTSNGHHLPLVSYAIGALLSGSDPWVTLTDSSDHPITLSPRIQAIPQSVTGGGHFRTDKFFADFLGFEVDVYTIGTAMLELRLDDWYILDGAEVAQWQPCEEEEIDTPPDYIRISGWGVRFQVPQGLEASYSFDSKTNTLTVTGVTANSLQYYPEFASLKANPDGLGSLVYLPDYDPDNSPAESYDGKIVECNDRYFVYYHAQAIFSTDPQEQTIEVQVADLIQQMLTEGIETV